jgi:hypothetical protein
MIKFSGKNSPVMKHFTEPLFVFIDGYRPLSESLYQVKKKL